MKNLTKRLPRVVPPPHAAFKGDVSRVILDILRETTRPLGTREVTFERVRSPFSKGSFTERAQCTPESPEGWVP